MLLENILIDFGYMAAAILVVWLVLKGLDWLGGRKFADTWAVIMQNPVAVAIYTSGRFIGVCLLAALILAACSVPAMANENFSNRYDARIKAATAKFWPRYVDWRWYKAQLIQESRLNPEALSPVGAAGIAQFMPGTWAEAQKALKLGAVSPRLAGPAIKAGAWYMAKQARAWSSPRPEPDRWNLARASYNAGLGNILKAQTACGGALLYNDIITCLPQITGHHARETITYNKRIAAYYKRMKKCRGRFCSVGRS